MPLKHFIPKELDLILLECKARYRFWHLLNLVKKENYDVIFCSIPDLSHELLLMKKFHLIRSKIIVRHCNMSQVFGKKSNMMTRMLYPKADAIISQTIEMKADMIQSYELPEKNITAINNPIDKEIIHASILEVFHFNEQYINYVAVGRVVPQKDHMTLLKAFEIVHNNNKKTRLYIVGGFDANSETYLNLQSFIETHNLSDSVSFQGFQANPFKYMNGCDVFCLSSVIEGMPNVLLEAMYLGKPCVVTQSIPYISQIINDGDNGYSVKVGDYIDFADKMIKASKITNLLKFSSVNDSEDQILQLFTISM